MENELLRCHYILLNLFINKEYNDISDFTKDINEQINKHINNIDLFITKLTRIYSNICSFYKNKNYSHNINKFDIDEIFVWFDDNMTKNNILSIQFNNNDFNDNKYDDTGVAILFEQIDDEYKSIYVKIFANKSVYHLFIIDNNEHLNFIKNKYSNKLKINKYIYENDLPHMINYFINN